VTYVEAPDGRAVFEGDIVIDPKDAPTYEGGPEEKVTVYGIITGNRYRWPDGVVPYEIDAAIPDAQRHAILDAIAHWEANTVIRMPERTAANASQYADYVRFVPVPPEDHCWSSVGRQRGRQLIGLAPRCAAGPIIHEIGQALGLWHEQSREDRDDFVTILWNNIDADNRHNFEQHISDGDDVGAYDYGSIMHYRGEAFSRNGQPTIVPTDPQARIGQRGGLSAGDMATVEIIYGGIAPSWFVSFGGESAWARIGYSSYGVDEVAFGDFDGDGRTDVFRATGSEWRVSWAGRSEWEKIHGSGYPLADLAFGDFDGDGRTDVFRASGSAWYVYWAGRSESQKIHGSNATLSTLGFGDFDGDGRTDVFRASGGGWFVSWAGQSSWEQINGSGVHLADLAFGDFDGDGRTDVFRATGSEWQVSSAGRSAWQKIHGSNATLSTLGFGDFDGDGRTDVFRASGGGWYVSWAGLPSWQRINDSESHLADLAFGDFDGDGRTDVFAQGVSDEMP
jgi:hypothetical protein